MLFGNMLMRGMLIGIVSGILSFGFLKIVGEPAVDRATTRNRDGRLRDKGYTRRVDKADREA
jgi:hypothetical protein